MRPHCVRSSGPIAQSGLSELSFASPPARFLRLRILENWGGDVYPVEPGTPIKGFLGFAGLREVRLFGVPDASPVLTGELMPDGRFRVRLSGQDGTRYTIQSSANDALWIDVLTGSPASGQLDYITPGPVAEHVQWFRAISR